MPFASLLAALGEIRDPRRPQGRRYTLAHLLLFSILAVLAGATSYQSIITFMTVHRERLNTIFGARFRRAPAVNTLRNLFLALDPADLEAVFRRHARHLDQRTGTGRLADRRAGWQDVAGQFRPSERSDRRTCVECVRQRCRVDPGASRGGCCPRRGSSRAGSHRGTRSNGRALHRRCAALSKRGFARAAATGNALLVRVKRNQPTPP